MYTYYALLDDINYLAHFGVDTGSIGSSEDGRLIPFVHVGDYCNNQIIISGGIHAREHVTSLAVIRQIFHFLNSYKILKDLKGGIYFLPMLNPDGNLLCLEGIVSAPSEKRETLIRINGGNKDFSLWKANSNGVDLNTNFDAKWSLGKQNVFSPSSANYVGSNAFCEKETKYLRDFSLKVKPKATVSYHALGNEIYWQFGQNQKDGTRDKKIAEKLNERLNYKIIGDDGNSTGGYKDWCIAELKIPSLTIEIVSDIYFHPILDYKCADDDFELNKDLPINLLNLINGIF